MMESVLALLWRKIGSLLMTSLLMGGAVGVVKGRDCCLISWRKRELILRRDWDWTTCYKHILL